MPCSFCLLVPRTRSVCTNAITIIERQRRCDRWPDLGNLLRSCESKIDGYRRRAFVA